MVVKNHHFYWLRNRLSNPLLPVGKGFLFATTPLHLSETVLVADQTGKIVWRWNMNKRQFPLGKRLFRLEKDLCRDTIICGK